jgi:predicted nucleic acid-binding protein
VENYLSSWTVFDVKSFVMLEAVRGVREHRFSYWDAQIWATARFNQIPVVLSDDFASGSIVELDFDSLKSQTQL